MQFEHTKHVADLFAQSKLKKVATDVFNCALRVQNRLFLQIGQLSSSPITSMVCGSAFLNNPIMCYLFDIFNSIFKISKKG